MVGFLFMVFFYVCLFGYLKPNDVVGSLIHTDAISHNDWGNHGKKTTTKDSDNNLLQSFLSPN